MKIPNLKKRLEKQEKYYFVINNCLWVRVPKNGGSSVATALGLKNQHLSLSEALKKMPDEEGSCREGFVITRNPYDRLLSCWRDLVKQQRKSWMDPNLVRSSDFEEFAFAICDIPDEKADWHFRSQSYPLEKIPINIKIHYIDLYELAANWEFIKKITKTTNALPHRRRTQETFGRRNYRELYSDINLRQKIYERYREDFDKFDYDF